MLKIIEKTGVLYYTCNKKKNKLAKGVCENMQPNQSVSKKFKIMTVTVIAVLFVLSVVLFVQFMSLARLRSTQAELQSYLSELQQSIDQTQDENSYLASDEFIEDYAREVLGYSTTGETRFR